MSALADAADVTRAIGAHGVLADFNAAGVLAAADVHVARALAAGEDEDVLLAIALAVRAPRLGHVRVDLATIRETAAVDAEETVNVSGLPWPDPDAWVQRVEDSELFADGDSDAHAERPLRLVGTAVYLDRYWREERGVAAALKAFAARATAVDDAALQAGLTRLFPGDQRAGRQAGAAEAAVRQRLAVVAGGPGTGKTTTVARIVALLAEQATADNAPLPLVALAAPTAKAAARLQEAVRGAAGDLATDDEVKALLDALEAKTLHRLLGWRPGSHSRFRHDRANRLPHDVVLVDETSMVSLSLMARLVEALREDARLVLVGDPGQLTSIEAGVVLGDIVGPAAREPRTTPTFGHGIVVLDHVHRYGGAIATLADAIRAGDPDATIEALAGVTWIDADPAESDEAVAAVRSDVVRTVTAVADAAHDGDAATALEALQRFRLLCAHRRGPHGVQTWTERIESWLPQTNGLWYVGRPLLVTENDYGLRLYNGDTGVVVAAGDGEVEAAFDRGGDLLTIRPGRLEAVESVYAMTIHKSQGSQFRTAAVVLPPRTSPILTRELLYTAITRAQEQLVVIGTEDAIRAAVQRPAARASGLRERLWGPGA